MAKYEIVIESQFEKVLDYLHENIMNSAMSMNLVDESNFSSGDTNIAVRVYDKYFMRNGNRASLSLTVVGKGNIIYVSAIGAGGGQGVLFNFSLGAEDDMVAVVQECMNQII